MAIEQINQFQMTTLSLQTTISNEQLYALLSQLSVEEKYELSNLLRAEASQEEWSVLSQELPDLPEITMEDIVAEIKAYRREKKEQND